MVVSERGCTIRPKRRIVRRSIMTVRQMKDMLPIIHTSIKVMQLTKSVRLDLTLTTLTRSKICVDQSLCLHNQVKWRTMRKIQVVRRPIRVARKIKVARMKMQVVRMKMQVVRMKTQVAKIKTQVAKRKIKLVNRKKGTVRRMLK